MSESPVYWSQPNQQVVRNGDPVAAGGNDPPVADDASDEFDPSRHTIADVEAYLDANPDDIDRVLAAEREGKNRTTLLNLYEDDDEG